MANHPDVSARLDRLAPDQRAAATAPPGPLLCVAPAGSGKTTTLVARIAWLIDGGVDPATIAAITFNRRAAVELGERLAAALAPLGVGAGDDGVRVRTFHALGREILLDAGRPVEPLIDRLALLRVVAPSVGPAGWRRLDTAISRLKLDLAVDPEVVAADPGAGPVARAYVAYERAVRETGGLDFDDLVAEAVRTLERVGGLLALWRQRCGQLLVDEAQDLDRCQLRLALLLAAPDNRIFLVGDDDQSIYGWRLADVRRILSLDAALPGLRRVDLVTNYRCPEPVVTRAVRLIEHNRERFSKRIRPRPAAAGRLVLAPDADDDDRRVRRLVAALPANGSAAVLARTNRELLPAVVAALELDIPFRATALELLVESPIVDELLDRVQAETDPSLPLLVRLARIRAAVRADEAFARGRGDADVEPPLAEAAEPVEAHGPGEVAAALLGWAVPYRDLGSLRAAIADRCERLARLRADDARLTLATAHGTKGLEFDHVAVIGLEAGRFPSRRSLDDAEDPARALEEERRLAYVAWTRARRSLLLSYDPAAASPFLFEAFTPAELGAEAGSPPRVP